MYINESNSDELDVSPLPSLPWDSSTEEFTVSDQSLKILSALRNEEQTRSRRRKAHICFTIFLIVTELLICSLFVIQHSISSLERVGNEFIIPLILSYNWTKSKSWKGLTYYDRNCDNSDQSAFSVSEIIADRIDKERFIQNINRHGVQILPNLLTEKTAADLRAYVLEQNRKDDTLIDFILEPNHRKSFAPQVDQHPSVTKAIQEMMNSELLIQALETVFGSGDATILELVVLTSEYGAKSQSWHPDIPGDTGATLYGRQYFDYYSMFVPLQNTTAEMGATGICPGLHMCNGVEDGYNKSCFQVAGDNDVWQTGWGVLYNSRLMHRGSAHTDPTDGHERVLLIPTFGPKPLLSRRRQFETRIIPRGSFYEGIHWTQFGHTVSDFGNSHNAMRLPWRALRSLGLTWRYDAWNFWDHMIPWLFEDETVLTPNNWVSMCMDMFPWLPLRMFGNATEYEDEKPDGEASARFLLSLLHVLQQMVELALLLSLSLFMILLCLQHNRPGKSSFQAIQRIAFIKGMLVVLNLLLFKMISNSYWAKNIIEGRTNNIPDSFPFFPDLPSTLPLKNDILITDHMQSRFFGAYRTMIDDSHPGNRFWKDHLVSHFSPGFIRWTPQLRSHMCKFVADLVQHKGRRILTRNEYGNWAVSSESDTHHFCYKSFMAASNSYVEVALQELEFLRTETQCGYWRKTALHRKAVPSVLSNLRDKILHYTPLPVSQFETETNGAVGRAHKVTSFLPSLPSGTRGSAWTLRERSPGFTVHLYPQEPREGAWLTEQDVVDVYATKSDNMTCLYPGYIALASANIYQYVVRLDSGGLEQVYPDWVIHYVAPVINEYIEFFSKERDAYIPAYVVGFDDDDGDDINVIAYEHGDLVTVQRQDIRRACYVMDNSEDPNDDDE